MSEIAVQIQQLIQQRQQGYAALTQLLLKKLEFVTTALVDACREHGDSDADRIQWADIQVNDETIFIIGTINLMPGAVINTENGTVKLTAEAAQHIQRKVIFNIAVEAFTKHTPEQIVDFIRQSVIISRASQVNEEQIEPAHEIGEGFDLTKLTPEQRQALSSYSLQLDNERPN